MHYYDSSGNSCHEQKMKNGKLRPTTIRDARKLGLLPSVTTIMDIQAKPALINWVQNQILEAAINTPFDNTWNVEEWKNYILNCSRSLAKNAAKRGNEIHDMLENSFSNDCVIVENPEDLAYIKPAWNLIQEQFAGFKFYSEHSFAHKDGFAGRVDLWGRNSFDETIIIDFKTKDKSDAKDFVQYDDHRIQLAAYQVGLGLPEQTRRYNLFISVHKDSPGLCKLVECKEFDKYKNIFYALKELWSLKNDYYPRLDK